jgi:lipopolysaccharide export system permease protein
LKKLDLYIIKKFLTTFFFILGVIMLIAIIFDVSEQIDDFIKREAPLKGILVDYYLNFILFYGNLFSPLLIFIAVIFFTSKMASNSEIVAILSAGISFKRVLVPYLIAATLLASISLYLNHWLLPKANESRIAFEDTYLRYKFRNHNKNIHKQIAPDEFLYFESFNTDRQTGFKISFEKWENGEMVQKLMGNTARWDSTANKWIVQNYQIREIKNGKETLRKGARIDTTLNITPDDFSSRKTISIQMMDYGKLNEFIEEEKLKGNEDVPLFEIEKYTRSSLPFATYILTIIGVSISSRKVRGGIGAHLALGLLLAVSYILFMKVSSVYATNAGLDPFIATWFPNIMFSFVAIYLIQKAHK